MKQSKTEKYISKSGKVMTTGKIINYARNVLRIDNIHKDVFELIDFAIKDLQQENARLKKQKDILKDNRDLWFKKSIHNGREIKRLRQALEEIKGLSKKKTMLNYCGSWLPMEEVFKIIDKALKGEKR